MKECGAWCAAGGGAPAGLRSESLGGPKKGSERVKGREGEGVREAVTARQRGGTGWRGRGRGRRQVILLSAYAVCVTPVSARVSEKRHTDVEFEYIALA